VAQLLELLGELVKRTTRVLQRSIDERDGGADKLRQQWCEAMLALQRFYQNGGALRNTLVCYFCCRSDERINNCWPVLSLCCCFAIGRDRLSTNDRVASSISNARNQRENYAH
jgi:hypothetical protein